MKSQKMTKRAQQAIETRATIYNAAIELMDSEGFENITVADISEKAGVSVGSFYHYFESKHSILAEIFHKGDEYFNEYVDGKLTDSDARKQIVSFFQHYARFNVITTVDTTKQLFNPKVTFFTEGTRPMVSILKRIINQGIESGQIGNGKTADELVRMLFIFARGVVFDWSLHDGDYDLEETMNDYMTFLVGSLP